MNLPYLVLAFLTLSTFATTLPVVQKPVELESGEFSEGTITQLSQNDIKQFLPWVNNAKKILDDALAESKRLPLNEKAHFLEEEIKRVVRGSGAKSYQMYMRFALNRGLLLSKILNEEANFNDEGIVQNQIVILTSAIELAKKYYESDLAFQKNPTSKLNYAQFAQDLGQSYLPLSMNIFDLSAQYRVLYKTLEMMNWDLSQDENAQDEGITEKIIEIHKTLERLPQSQPQEEKLFGYIQSMNYLVQKSNLGRFIEIQEKATREERVAKHLQKGNFRLVSRVGSTEIWQDEISGLTWSDRLPSTMGYPGAIKACEEYSTNDKAKGSWRLPSREEYEEAEKKGIRKALPNMNYCFWSSSVHRDYSNHVWLFNGYYGNTGNYYRNNHDYSVRCVAR